MTFKSLCSSFVQLGYKTHLTCAFLLRVVLILYGNYHDANFNVPYTDVDYHVFTDAARHVLNKTSPYKRHTYRYSPLLSYLVIPNLLVHESFGKVLFSFLDIAVAILIRNIVLHSLHTYDAYLKKQTTLTIENQQRKKRPKNDKTKNNFDFISNLSVLSWLYNPLTIAIATRGNCDSISSLLVLTTLYCLQCKKLPFVAGLVHGLSIHFRLYPISYSLSFFMYLSDFAFYSTNYRAIRPPPMKETENGPKLLKPFKKPKKTIFKKEYIFYLIPNFKQIKLITGCLISLTSLIAYFYYLYGDAFLYETYLYHLTRKDTRHNFSLYFYLQYLTVGIKNIGIWQKILTVLPQSILLAVFSVRYGLNRLTLNFAIVTQTIVIVAYNSVITSQYFVWILSVLPLCLWQIKLSAKTAAFLIFIWFAAQITWLIPAYFLEFHGYNTFIFIWVQSVSLFCSNIIVLGRLVINFMQHEKPKQN